MPKHVLVIDDEKAIRDAFTGALAEIGYAVETAASGDEGLAMAKARPPDLVFLDLRMPGMNGVEVLGHLQEPGGPCAEVPVYIVTAFRREFIESLRKASDDGLRFDIADKPLTIEQIQQIARGKLEGGVAS